ncbi:MAG: single-stranded DNA-binding protein [Chlamydiales bacterium]|nr:single-stranded DNA-binding protein [Chlamydiales bacterium]
MIIVEIAGFLGADPEERFTATGKRVVSLRVATRVRQRGQDDTVWWRVDIWGDRFDKMLPYLKKGSGVIVIGKMGKKPETYVAKDGTTQVSLTLSAEIVEFSPFGRPESTSGKSENQGYGNPPYQNGAAQEQYAATGAGAEQEHAFAGDDLPF